jgi:hypothetical protein
VGCLRNNSLHSFDCSSSGFLLVRFDKKQPSLAGGPGSGKVTHCDSLMQEKKGITHINMTDLLQQYAIGNGKCKSIPAICRKTFIPKTLQYRIVIHAQKTFNIINTACDVHENDSVFVEPLDGHTSLINIGSIQKGKLEIMTNKFFLSIFCVDFEVLVSFAAFVDNGILEYSHWNGGRFLSKKPSSRKETATALVEQALSFVRG